MSKEIKTWIESSAEIERLISDLELEFDACFAEA